MEYQLRRRPWSGVRTNQVLRMRCGGSFRRRVSSYLQFRGWIRQETWRDRRSVTFDLRQCACLIWPNTLVVEGDLDVVGVLAW